MSVRRTVQNMIKFRPAFMPPNLAYNWLCVLCSTANIVSHATCYGLSRVACRSACLQYKGKTTIQKPSERSTAVSLETSQRTLTSNGPEHVQNQFLVSPEDEPQPLLGRHVSEPVISKLLPQTASVPPSDVIVDRVFVEHPLTVKAGQPRRTENMESSVSSARSLSPSEVPSSRIGRLFHYGGLAASLGYGAASEIIRRANGGSRDKQSSVFMTAANIRRLVSKLSRMRGAALKLGQFLSVQDTNVLPPEVDQIFRKVQDSAHYMPDWQMEKVMATSLGSDWMTNFESFERLPFAAASIGQVHDAVLAASVSPTARPEPVAVKIQFPNIVNSIDSDLSYIQVLLTAGRLLPKGLFLNRSVEVLKHELTDECDYNREGRFLTLFRSHLGGDRRFKVPWVWKGSTKVVLVMERVDGTSVGGADINGVSQRDKNNIAAWILELCLRELFEFRAMQTDPNWSNFLWNPQTQQVELVDFGATREYSKEFMDNWLRLLQAAASEDRQGCVEWSLKLGYLTGEENEVMLNAHIDSMVLLATPFKTATIQPYHFGPGSSWLNITAEIRNKIPVMLNHRLTPPPQETYSLNRKLSGTFLLATRLNATIDAKAIWDSVTSKYQFNL